MFGRGDQRQRLVFLGFSNGSYAIIAEANGIANKYMIPETSLLVQGDPDGTEISVLVNNNLGGSVRGITLLIPPGKTINV